MPNYRDLHYFDRDRKQKWRIAILHDDEALLVLNKPAGLPVIPERWHPDWPCLRSIAEERLGLPLFVVHRIDAGTSGLILFAKTEASHRDLNQQFEHHHVEKIYHALVSGEVVEDALTMQQPLAEHPHRPGMMIVSREGKPAVTLMRVLERFHGATLVEAQPQTGRQHQIRVHLQALGHPLLVDSLYGNAEAFFLSSIKPGFYRKPEEPEQPLIKRLTLHACALQFHHPLTHAPTGFTAPAPKDFQAALKNLRKYAHRK